MTTMHLIVWNLLTIFTVDFWDQVIPPRNVSHNVSSKVPDETFHKTCDWGFFVTFHKIKKPRY